ncbi:MAG: hypothetical protein IJL15_00015 [Clostridia bacterium]|nr:hypothetical protein [Clostridia bacterium]
MGVLTDLEDQIIEIGKRDNIEKGIIICAILALNNHSLEHDVQEYLDRHPDTSFMDLDDYIISLCPPLEIVDDEELDEEE